MKTIQHEFVEFIPEELQEGVLYITVRYRTAVHKCVCGCGNKVVTPLSPTDWKLIFDGKTVSLYPSIGNWNFKCRSHYWITKNEIIHSYSWSNEEVNEGRKKDRKKKKKFFSFLLKASQSNSGERDI
jgi:hypothetical protein